MNASVFIGADVAARPSAWGRVAAGIALGLTTTAGIFFGLAYFDRRAPEAMAPEVQDLRAVAVPEPPPPPPEVHPTEAVVADVLGGIEPLPSDSAVHLMAPPPDLEALLAPPELAPPAVIQTGQLYSNLRPKLDTAALRQRIYQTAEVDQIPRVITRVDPRVPTAVRNGAPQLRATLFFVVDVTGEIKNLRVASSSGNPEFDRIVLENIKEWTFSPAVRRGQKVRCLLYQAVTVKWNSTSTPFTL